MDNEGNTDPHTELVPRQVDIAPMPKEHLLRTDYELFAQIIPSWHNYASLRHTTDIALDSRNGWLWMATWGGVLCWDPQARRCVRHTSAHGLPGNAIRHIAVDRDGIVWASGWKRGLSYLDPELDRRWEICLDSQKWAVRCLTSRQRDGIYLALENAEGQSALAELDTPEADLHILCDRGLAFRAVDALHAIEKDVIWLGNSWGLHCYRDGNVASYEFVDDARTRIQVRAIAQSPDGWLWVGTQRGLYRFHENEEQPFVREEDWPRDMVLSIAVEPESGDLWCLTPRGIGRVYEGIWQPALQVPAGRLNKIFTVPQELREDQESSLCLPQGQAWLGGENGLYKIGMDSYDEAFLYETEDALSNAIQALSADNTGIWVGSARGLYHFDGEMWQDYTQEAPALLDVRTIASGQAPDQIWIGSWRMGLQRLSEGVYIPGQVLNHPVVAIATGLDSSMWAATIDTVYWRPSVNNRWQPLSQPVRDQLGDAIIQTMCHQLAPAPGGGTESTLWVGTSAGLFYYRPEREAWGREGALGENGIQTLLVDEETNRLWVGTSAGLFSEPDWLCCREANITALSIDSEPNGLLWIGTTEGLEAWVISEGKVNFRDGPVYAFTAANSGLAANKVTALATRTADEQQELWIGSPNGLSRYQITRIA